MGWSPDGRKLATIARDHVIRIYDPRRSTSPVNEGVGPEGSRGARIVWLTNTHLVVTGFNRWGIVPPCSNIDVLAVIVL